MNNFNLKDLRPLLNLNGRRATIDNSRFIDGFPGGHRNVALEIIEELRLRNFDVPGYEVDFWLHIKDGTVSISNVTRGEFSMGSWTHIGIPGKKVNIHSDGSGSMDVFVGGPGDMGEFLTGTLFHRKMDGKKKINIHYNLRNHFDATNDCREYVPEGNERDSYSMGEILGEILEELNKQLEYLRAQPTVKTVDVFVEPEPIQLTNPLFEGVKLYGFRDGRYNGEEKMGIEPSHRLLSYGIPLPEDHPYGDQMHDGFVYLELEPASNPVASAHFQYGMYRDDVSTFEVVPKNWNNVWVVDASVFEKMRSEWFERNPDETCLTDTLVTNFKRDMARTMVHINDYEGGYETPVVITNKNLWPEEIKRIEIKNSSK